MPKCGLFVGLITGDMLYLASHVPGANEKIVASDYCFTVGGPATNVAIAFRHLGSETHLLGGLGKNKLGLLLGEELQHHGIKVIDLKAGSDTEPPMSSIIVTEATGDRAVVSLNAKSVSYGDPQNIEGLLETVDIVLIDGHVMNWGAVIAKTCQAKNIPVVVDAGSWKANFEAVLKFTDFAICSSNFHPPDCSSQDDVVAYLKRLGIPNIAITQGGKPTQFLHGDRHGEIAVPSINIVDTLGAGDIFHGAFCHYILKKDFEKALQSAAEVASYSCQFFGTRAWLKGNRFGSN